MKSIARLHVWWPNLDREIENCAKQCITCQENSKNPPKSQLHPWETATQPWERLYLDAGLQGYVHVVCSKWPEVISMTSTTAEKTTAIENTNDDFTEIPSSTPLIGNLLTN